jgi:hypothetical protein
VLIINFQLTNLLTRLLLFKRDELQTSTNKESIRRSLTSIRVIYMNRLLKLISEKMKKQMLKMISNPNSKNK